MPAASFVRDKLFKGEKGRKWYDFASAIVIVASFILALSFIVGGLNNPFLYTNF